MAAVETVGPDRGRSLASAAVGALGLASVAVILAGSFVTGVAYTGHDGEAYSPFNHYISELGQLSQSQLAQVFNVGLILGAIGLAAFIVLVSRSMPARYGLPFAVVGLISGAGGGLVGVFPMDHIAIHRLVAFTFFLTGWILVLIFSVWQLRDRDCPFPRWLIAEAAVVVVAFLAFLGSMTTVKQTDTLEVISDRPGFWIVPALEWLALLSLLAWFALVAVAILRPYGRQQG